MKGSAPALACGACKTSAAPLVQLQVPGVGLAWVCLLPSACRQRAQLAGVYGAQLLAQVGVR